MPSGIYTIQSPSGSLYVGSAVHIERRWIRHRKDLRAGKHGNINLQRAAAKYGIDALRFGILLVCSPGELLMYEQRAIDALKPRYNIAPVAGSSLGIKRTAEFKAKVSFAALGRIVSDETRAKIGAKHKGKKLAAYQIEALRAGRGPVPAERASSMHTPEAKAKKAKSMIGHQISEETKAKISAALKGRKHSPERIAAIMSGKGHTGCAAITQQNGS